MTPSRAALAPADPDAPTEPKRVRCAIYTRKSTTEGLQQDFNTLDAQRESAEFYIRAMKHEGWEALPSRYDDGGYSGATIDRPAMQRLLADIDAGLVDCVVVYKVDRLSRSILDFAKLLAAFDEKNVGFVSTTQHFNTRDAMGRLTLNIVVSFAQFEREMIADRTRDKMGAARKRGKWLGSRPLLGYRGDREAMRLVVLPEEAEQVRSIFRLYLRLGSTGEVARHLNHLGWERKRWVTKGGVIKGGGPWTDKDVHLTLRQPSYLGKVFFQGALYDGQHEAIIDEALYEQVQRKLGSKVCGRGDRRGRRPEYLLQGLAICGGCGGRFTTGNAKGRKGEYYRYYLCLTRRRHGASRCRHPNVAAVDLENAVLDRVKQVCADEQMRRRITGRMAEVQPSVAAAVLEARTANEARRTELRAEADGLIRAIAREADAFKGHLLLERVGAIESELDELTMKANSLDKQFRALQESVEHVSRTVSILELFDVAWQSFSQLERQDLVRLLVSEVRVDEPAGRVDIRFHDLEAPLEEVAMPSESPELREAS